MCVFIKSMGVFAIICIIIFWSVQYFGLSLNFNETLAVLQPYHAVIQPSVNTYHASPGIPHIAYCSH